MSQVGAPAAAAVSAAARWIDPVLAAILLAALLLRFGLAATQPYIHDEDNTAIPLSKTISFAPGHLNLPLRGENHGALPAYIVKASGALFGTTPLGYRSLHLMLGLATIVLVYVLTRQWYGAVAARWAAALLAFNEYSLTISSRATAHVPHLLFVAAALFAFGQFLRSERAVYLYAAGGAVGLAFYAKEHSALLLPVFLLALLSPPYRRWLRGPHAYLAALTFALMIAPDVYWNLTTNRETARVPYAAQEVAYATYSSHLQRIGGIGLSPYPVMFYARDEVKALHRRLTGRELTDNTAEYRSMNPALGVLLLGAVLTTTVRSVGHDELRRFLLLAFWGIFGFFTLIARGDPPGRLDPASWIWVENTIFPATILAGARLAGALGAWRVAAWAVCGGALVYASAPAAPVDSVLSGVASAVAVGRHTAGYVSAGLVDAVRAHPLRAVGIAAAAGALGGLLVGLGCGRQGRRRARDHPSGS